MTKEEFIKGINYLGMAYSKEFNQMEITQIYQFLKEYSYEVFIKAINKIIRTSSFMPKIADLIKECENSIKDMKFNVLEFMKEEGYFKRGSVKELDDLQAARNYNKAVTWLQRGIIPDWFISDYNYYKNKMDQLRLVNKQSQLKLG